ncbi:tryptophan synthase beta subunit-like PLP-dependent enzyme [Aspergillus heteromorphus CBS 117.55]|uniref:Tryptophan synthase beta subunit-like PLP-dependent enzyme n=1 Tax=Aspergillus heteromorphus CBS 117.55 TaxID=1448321 RepID=A0A317WN47_9EURO|nr:tryptophan synthase beta subunit-like PLP-dependent enzyme [Aspergillus heteromorphus CBS 117.55]PWY87465.1 tryptophan synthase beta subunit-like PLP-dependent enzyme [Aspergillus heteromorphus CBS 117.55]
MAALASAPRYPDLTLTLTLTITSSYHRPPIPSSHHDLPLHPRTIPHPAAIHAAYTLIQPHVHQTPLLTCQTLNTIASTPQSAEALSVTPYEGQAPANPTFRFFFKCENYQRIGAFKARGAFHALLRLIAEKGKEEVARRGVITHSSGNHAQALALAASTLGVPAYIIMPTISTPSKIAGTKSHGAEVIFSGSTSVEREAVVEEVQAKTGAILVPPYDDFNIICGQGTCALELEGQYRDLVKEKPQLSIRSEGKALDAVITPIGGGGLNAGVATFFSDKTTKVFGAEPSFEGGDDCRRGLDTGERVDAVSTLTIADGLRTPVGLLNWEVIADREKVAGVFAVTEEQIKAAMRLVLERMKVVVEPSAVVGLAVCLYNEEFRRLVEKEAPEGWDVGIVFSGGNTTVEAIGKLFS